MLPGVTLVLVGEPILTPSSNPALRGVNLEVVGEPTQNTVRAVIFVLPRLPLTASTYGCVWCAQSIATACFNTTAPDRACLQQLGRGVPLKARLD